MLQTEQIKVDIPHEPGNWMKFRTLSWKKLKKARKKQEKENREIIKDFGAEFMKVLRTGDEEKARKLLEKQQYHVSNFDVETLLNEGIAAWSYEEDIIPENIDELDERTAQWAAQTLIDLVKPPDRDNVKNSSGDSIEV